MWYSLYTFFSDYVAERRICKQVNQPPTINSPDNGSNVWSTRPQSTRHQYRWTNRPFPWSKCCQCAKINFSLPRFSLWKVTGWTNVLHLWTSLHVSSQHQQFNPLSLSAVPFSPDLTPGKGTHPVSDVLCNSLAQEVTLWVSYGWICFWVMLMPALMTVSWTFFHLKWYV